ncbi:hypothetical protein ALON55S_02134 [Alishewanella longhuensis]
MVSESLESRNETLLKVANCIVQQQQAFFEHGEEAMKPMVLNDVAEMVGMHESTISRHCCWLYWWSTSLRLYYGEPGGKLS